VPKTARDTACPQTSQVQEARLEGLPRTAQQHVAELQNCASKTSHNGHYESSLLEEVQEGYDRDAPW